ncbi:hypothetical protein [Methylococcus capsulatus]|jgi:uncharacterized protein YcnI|uniref:hypothetical protein n=1 Tax=Methylococcus capsulatus TaxID=414 RepID=UPI002FD9D080
MSNTNKFLSLSLLSAGVALSAGQVFGHAGFQAFPDGSSVKYIEGKTVYPTAIIPHDCSEGEKHFPVVEVVVMPPQGHTLNRIAKPVSGQPVQVIENAMMWDWGTALPSMTAGFGKVETRNGPIHPTGDGTRAMVWKNGNLPGTQYAGFTFRVKAGWQTPLFPADACVNQAVYYMPTVQYCSKKKVEAWLLEPTPSFPVSSLGDANGAAPSVTVVRDTASNPLPAGCTSPETWYFYPSSNDIDQFMYR